jgi:dihydropteroate synthase
MRLFGVINASPDSLNTDSIATTAAQASQRARFLLGEGCWGLDIGGQGSTSVSTEVDATIEWERLDAVIPTLVAFDVPTSVDTWRPSVARRALDAGVTWLNAAEGMQDPAMIELAAERGCPVVLPFLNGPDPHHLAHVAPGYDPVQLIIDFFDDRLRALDRHGIRANCVLDPGTGFAPHDWAWEDRFHYQKEVYSRLHELRRFGLPIYIALPWRDTAQHAELMEIVVRAEPEYGRVHIPAQVAAARAHVATAGA